MMLASADRAGESCRRSGASVRRCLPPHRTSPLGATAPKISTRPRRRTRPAMPISRLDLPLPFGPVIAHASPAAMLNVASCTATMSPYATDRPRTASAAIWAAGGLAWSARVAEPTGLSGAAGFTGFTGQIPGGRDRARRPRVAGGPGAGRWTASPARGSWGWLLAAGTEPRSLRQRADQALVDGQPAALGGT